MVPAAQTDNSNVRITVDQIAAYTLNGGTPGNPRLGATPGSPTPGSVQLGESSLAGIDWPSWRSAQSPERFFNPLLNRTKFVGIVGTAGSNFVLYGALQDNGLTRDGASGNRVNNTTYRMRQATSTFYMGATQNQMRRAYSTISTNWMGDGEGRGGFLCMIRFTTGDNWGTPPSANSRFFIGLSSSTSEQTNVNPATVINQIGIAKIDGSPNLNIVYGGSSAQTPINLGASFSATDLTGFYELILYSDPNDATQVRYILNRWGGATAAITETTGIQSIPNTTPGTTLPAAATGLGPRWWICNHTDATPAAIGVQSFFTWSD